MWIFYALVSAYCVATTDALSKKILQTIDGSVVIGLRFLFACPVLLVLLPFIDIPAISSTFWLILLILIPLEVSALILYMRAIRVSPLSLTIPFLSLTPVFLILTGWLMLGERVDAQGSAGIGLVALGAYTLHIDTFPKGWLAPLRAIFLEKGSQLMMLVAFIYSITSVLGKAAILQSSPAFFSILYVLVLTLAFAPLGIEKSKTQLSQIRRCIPLFLAVGFFQSVMVLSHTMAISQAYAAYMIAVKRTSLLISIAYGHFLFREARIRQRLFGAVLMIAGVATISLR